MGGAEKGLTDGSRHIAGIQVGWSELLQNGLKVMVAVLIDEGDPYVIAFGQLASASEPNEPPLSITACAIEPRVRLQLTSCYPHRMQYPARDCNNLAIKPVHPVWWDAPTPLPVSPSKYS